MQNYSGSLGSYGFLYTPGDFAFVSATNLESYLGSRKTINGKDLYAFHSSTSNCPCWPFGIGHHMDIEEWFYIYRKICRHGEFFHGLGQCWPDIGIFGNCHYTQNTHDFVHKYIRLCIGEPTDMNIGRKNINARKFLYALLSVMKMKAEKEKMGNVLNFINNFFQYKFSDNENGGEFNENIQYDFEGGNRDNSHCS